MKIRDNVLRQSHVARYGGGSYELVVGYDEPGCPLAYHLTYEAGRPEEPSIPRSRGTAIHAALELMESEAVSVDEALSRVWPIEMGPGLYMETLELLMEWLSGGDDGTHTVDSEVELTMPLYVDEDFGPVSIGGRIDRLAIVMDDPRTLIVDDYKSDQAPPTYRDLDNWFQGYFYAALADWNAPRWLGEGVDPRIEVRYVALRHYTLSKPYTRADLNFFKAWAEAVARRILRDDTHEPHLNPGCGNCQFRMDCPEWLSLPEKGETFLERIRNTSLEEQIPLRPKASEIRLALEKFQKGIDDLAKDRLQIGASLTAGGYSVAREPREQDVVTDVRAAHKLLGDEFYELVTVGKGVLVDWGKRHPDKMGKVLALLEKRVVGDGLKWKEAQGE